MTDNTAQGLLGTCGLPAAWAGCSTWRILHIEAQDLHDFLHAWAAWRDDAQRPRTLNYVVIASTAECLAPSAAESTDHAALAPLVRALAAQCASLLPGFQRLAFEHGQVLLTICIGPLKSMLREQSFVADTVFYGPSLEKERIAEAPHNWDRWTVKALARCCWRRTTLATRDLPATVGNLLRHGGFELERDDVKGFCSGRYAPRWEPKTTRQSFSSGQRQPGSCAVIGAGLAGAGVAAALARRGWQIQVFDAAITPAQGASGLPVGLMVHQVSADTSPRSRLSAHGLRMMHQEAARLLVRDKDWAPSGVMEHRPDADEIWHADGAWVRPARLVEAWLHQPGVTFHGASNVASLSQSVGEWVLRDTHGAVLGRAQHVVLAAASGSLTLLDQFAGTQPVSGAGMFKLPAMTMVAGQVSWGIQSAADSLAMPAFPVNGSGSLIPSIPFREGLGWFAGATYEPVSDATPAVVATSHRANFKRLTALDPLAAAALRHHFDSGNIQAWRHSRLVSSSRLPVVGALVAGHSPTLWICTALGSRGLTLAALCAELLAARMGGEPWSIEATLARSIDSMRSKQALVHME